MRQKITGTLFCFWLFALPLVLNAQFVVEAVNDVPIFRESGSSYANPWAGGLNSVQISKLDADFDGAEDDIFVFDRAGNRTLVFLGNNSGGMTTYAYDPGASASFPDMRNFSLLRDFDCDGKRDLFTYSSAGSAMAVYRNTGNAAGLSWEMVSTGLLSFYDFGSTSYTTNIYTSSQDIPAIFDYEDDGDLDIMSFNVGGSFIELHLNNSMDGSGECGLEFFLANRCYGGFIEGEDSNDINLDPDDVAEECTFNVVDPRTTGGARHVGSTILTLDGNNDGLHDVVLGDVGFQNMVYLENSGQGDDQDQIVSFDSSFPASLGGSPISIDNFPGAFYEDVDGDEVPDLLVGVNATSGASTYESVHLYLNSGTESSPDFSFASSAFLQNEMPDWGSFSSPMTYDYNEDGLMDLVVGYNNGLPSGELNEPRLVLLENTGNDQQPSFQVIDDNWLDLPSIFTSSNPSPAFADFDGDGDEDLVVGFLNGSLHYFENDEGFEYSGLIPSSDGITNVGNLSVPSTVDLNGDGKMDLVVGESEGNLNYFQNSGNSENPLFTLTSDQLGGINSTVTPPYFEGSSAPFFYDFDGTAYLVVGSKSGDLFQFETGGAEENWTEITEGFGAYPSPDAVPSGLNTKPVIYDFNGDGIPEIVSGLITGGLQYFEGTGVLSTEESISSKDFAVSLFPNPSSGYVQISVGDENLKIESVSVCSMDGRLMYFTDEATGTLDLKRLEAGAYVVRIDFGNAVSSERLIMR